MAQVTVLVVPGGYVAKLDGDVDIAVADRIETEILRQTEATAALIVDLATVSFLDSAGVRLIDRLVGRQEKGGALARIVAPQGSSTLFTLQVCGFRPELLVATRQAAMASVAQR
ncbi:STAS domain-containing protein [Micromonospora sp. NPDC049679]|uniref:STAS domain-containing protein n=1 Tax=Micromonospora sp. NPDC049679 TaxID=3155920 RepID=UPI0034061B58